MKTHNKVMEYFWLFTSLVGVGFSYWVLRHGHWRQNWTVMIVPVVAFLLFVLRRTVRKKTDSSERKNK